MTPTLIVCEPTDRWRLAWQTWQRRRLQLRARGSSAVRAAPATLRSVRRLDELPSAIERWRAAGVLLEVAGGNRVSVCECLIRLARGWPSPLLLVAGDRAARGAEATLRWAGAAACAWSVRELQPLVDWFEDDCQRLEAPPSNWEEQIRATLPWSGTSGLTKIEEQP